MNTTTLKAASTHGGPIVLGAGLMMLAVAVVGTPGGSRPLAQAPPPAASSSPSMGSSAPPVRVSSPDPRPRPSAVSVVVAGRDAAGDSDRTAGGGRASSSSSSVGTPGGARPTARPSPTGGPPASGVSVSLRRPLGLLPDVDLTIGGNSR